MITIIQFFLNLRRRSEYVPLKIFLAYVLLIALSSVLVGLVEPEGSPLKDFWEAVWWSIVTSTTVGYGDISPVSGAGKLVAVILPMFLGILIWCLSHYFLFKLRKAMQR